ncbi:lipocalin family protein [Flavobacterium sp.]|uniref:lipocalin family protein n=1 Tax=Flavobacterium sp. TaxID=239 RepID=UPI0040338635
MKKTLSIFIIALIASLAFIACNDESDETLNSDPITGTWKLIAMHTNGQETPVSECGLMETYIFGEEQFSHELFNGSDNDESEDESEDEGEDESDDENDASENDETEVDDTPEMDDTPESDENDDESDDDPENGSNCTSAGATVGFWSTQDSQAYTLTSAGGNTVLVVYFENGGSRFYYDHTVIENGQEITRRYYFQKQ